jgi:hypothetical protein
MFAGKMLCKQDYDWHTCLQEYMIDAEIGDVRGA